MSVSELLKPNLPHYYTNANLKSIKCDNINVTNINCESIEIKEITVTEDCNFNNVVINEQFVVKCDDNNYIKYNLPSIGLPGQLLSSQGTGLLTWVNGGGVGSSSTIQNINGQNVTVEPNGTTFINSGIKKYVKQINSIASYTLLLTDYCICVNDNTCVNINLPVCDIGTCFLIFRNFIEQPGENINNPYLSINPQISETINYLPNIGIFQYTSVSIIKVNNNLWVIN
jgi:hypothetical protein